ncbi:MAG: sodium-dependent transporter [Lachnospiraceae bacterium]|jgi:NSS family neurotransmitter:Na+ symporter
MQNRHSFKGSIGFVLAAAGSAVGLGNIWRFPYLAAKDGGGLFLVVYIILALTFGFTLLTTELAIGRKTKQSPLTAYSVVKKGWKPLGVIGCIVPMMILPYYCAIGGWVLKYFIVFVTGQGVAAAEDGFFTGFITGTWEPIVFLLIFLAACAIVIYRGVNKGIESLSKVLMPILIILVIAISVYSLTLSHTGSDGVTRTGLDGLKVYLIPNFEGITVSTFMSVLMDACGQLFYSLSVAMGIMVAYGSYVKDSENLAKSINRIEIFDTLIAFLAGIMIIPAVFAFSGYEGLAASGPSLMFVSLPKVFASMGFIGNIVGAVFFAMVFFAALTSGISILEAIVSSFMDQFKISRNKATTIESIIALAVGILVCLGYNVLYFEHTLPNGAVAQILDILDYISNNILMPVVSIGTCILIGWIVKPKYITDELTKNGERFGRKGLYNVMIKVIAPVILIILLLKSLGIVNFL